MPDTFVLMAAAVRNDEQGQGHAGRVITAVREYAAARGPEVDAGWGIYREPNVWLRHA
ncbi:hypothetical protein OG394_31560 [Kribbella sp. NBC_01245]|uniref:hypothetical protein n=1 Tax=Kribbella sp. NBC_01245 TaxID=2903578 RepID=UPI002E2CCBA6|nr:hypothetical protein [Kribbella sp. NBC_01245]